MNYKVVRYSLDVLNEKFKSGELEKANYVFIIESHRNAICVSTLAENCEDVVQRIAYVIDIYEKLRLGTLFLVKPEFPPIEGVRQDEVVTSLAFPEDHLKTVLAKFSPENLRQLCFHLASYGISSEATNGRILARSLDDLSYSPCVLDSSELFTIALPHQGDLSYLDACLERITDSVAPPRQTWVYFDEELTEWHHELIKSHPFPRYRKVEPPNGGPYIPRNHCAEHSNTSYICFQDSDDLPTFERFAEIYNYVEINPEIDMAGCHELRIDELDEKVIAVRFPLNVTHALAITASHPLFHPTAFVKCASLKEAGLFSTVRRYGADSQFLLRAHFFMKIGNINKFLYIRRKRGGSLTTSPDTMLGSKERTKLDISWKSDFELVKSGNLSLESSSLQAEHLPSKVEVVEINA